MLSWLTEMQGMDEKVYRLGEEPAAEAGWIGLGLVQELKPRLPPSVALGPLPHLKSEMWGTFSCYL